MHEHLFVSRIQLGVSQHIQAAFLMLFVQIHTQTV